MKKYFLIGKATWDETFAYRFNFAIWRIRTVLGFLTTYFLWLSLIPSNGSLFGYTQSLMLTYVMGTTIVGSVILSSRSQDIGDQINSGNLSNYLVRPINFFIAWFARDMGDKAMNIFFAAIEIAILFLLLRPPFFIQTNIFLLFYFGISIVIGIFIYFFTNILLGSIGFWSPEIWAPRFIFFTLQTFFSGGLFPLDILPKIVFDIFMLLPFPYFMYFPLKIYLGQLAIPEIILGIFISCAWLFILFYIVKFVWGKGMQSYSAAGR